MVAVQAQPARPARHQLHGLRRGLCTWPPPLSRDVLQLPPPAPGTGKAQTGKPWPTAPTPGSFAPDLPGMLPPAPRPRSSARRASRTGRPEPGRSENSGKKATRAKGEKIEGFKETHAGSQARAHGLGPPQIMKRYAGWQLPTISVHQLVRRTHPTEDFSTQLETLRKSHVG